MYIYILLQNIPTNNCIFLQIHQCLLFCNYSPIFQYQSKEESLVEDYQESIDKIETASRNINKRCNNQTAEKVIKISITALFLLSGNHWIHKQRSVHVEYTASKYFWKKCRGWRNRGEGGGGGGSREKETDSRLLGRFSFFPTPPFGLCSLRKVQQRVQRQNGWRWTGTPLGVHEDEEGKPIERREGRPERSNGSWSRYCMALPDELSAENIAILVSKSREQPARPEFVSLSLSCFSCSPSGHDFSSFSFVFRSRKEGRQRLEWDGVGFKGWFCGSRSFRLLLVVSASRFSERIWYIGTYASFIPLFSFFFVSAEFCLW